MIIEAAETKRPPLKERLEKTWRSLETAIVNFEDAQTNTPAEDDLKRDAISLLSGARDRLAKKFPGIVLSFPPKIPESPSPTSQPLLISLPQEPIVIPIERRPEEPITQKPEKKPGTEMGKAQVFKEQGIDISPLLSIFKGRERLIPADREGQEYLLMMVRARIAMAKGDLEMSRDFTAAYREKGKVLRARLAQQIKIIHEQTSLPTTTTVEEPTHGEVALSETQDQEGELDEPESRTQEPEESEEPEPDELEG